MDDYNVAYPATIVAGKQYYIYVLDTAKLDKTELYGCKENEIVCDYYDDSPKLRLQTYYRHHRIDAVYQVQTACSL
jgi:hypothetical protein